MDEAEVFPKEAADVAMQAIADGVARIELSYDEVFKRAYTDLQNARAATKALMDNGFIPSPPQELIAQALSFTQQVCSR
jgi:malate dehydrogenase (oxaloacetate-decarboxylating)